MGKIQGCVEFILNVINFVFIVMGLDMIGLGLVYFVMWKQNPSEEILDNSNAKYFILHRMLLPIHQPSHSYHQLLPKAWFIYLMIGFGATLIIFSCFGYVGTKLRSPCCLFSYCVFMFILVIVELGTSAFTFFEHNWNEVISKDRSGSFQRVYDFVKVNWKVMRWVALGIFTLQVIGTVIEIYLRSVYNKRAISDDVEDLSNNRRPNYIMLRPANRSPSTTSNANGREPNKAPK